MKAYEIYQQVDPSLVEEMLLWVREEEHDLYKTTLATLAASRKVRPVFVQKKSRQDQIAWLHQSLKRRTSDMLGEHLWQAWFMQEKQDLLGGFCDGVGIAHDGKGAVSEALPETIDAGALKATVENLLSQFDPQLVALYLRIFNLQVPGGWGGIKELLESDERLALSIIE